MLPGGVSPNPLFDMALSYRRSKALLTAVELGVFSVLARQRLDARSLASNLELNTRGASDFFDGLVALGLLQRDDVGRYGNTPITDQFLDQAKSGYVGDVLRRASTRAYGNWNKLPVALRTGQPQSGSFGTDGYGALYEDPAALSTFLQAMTGSSLSFATALARCLDWSRYTRVMDVGTAEGCVPVQLALAHPHLEVCGYDLSPVGPWFARYTARHGVSARSRFHAGDFRSDPLPPADAIIMARVLHNWSVPVKSMLLTKAYAALPSGGMIVVCETLIDDARCVNADALLASLHMLIETADGHELTGGDYVGWLETAGFCGVRVQGLDCAQSAVVGFKS
jgi:hypothetical protein